ncbi:hypothetical protein C8R45DRAFT_901342 [Mycena sanguinolenta]|nr:hypothetical protein C8R45DRAFT_901342 [Mycena sanguinolenta]
MPSSCFQCGGFVLPASGNFALDLTPHTLACLTQLSSSNEPPVDAELSVVRPVAQITSAHLALLDQEISRVKGRLRELEKEHTALSESHAQNMSILSPLRRVPTEILGEIFSWTLPLSLSHQSVVDVENCPWVLTHVCRRWRAVALSTPSLWSLIIVDFAAERH